MFRITDWAGNDLTAYYGTFETFEDAWEALYIKFPNGHDDGTFDDFFVLESGDTRETNFVEPNDIRNTFKVKG